MPLLTRGLLLSCVIVLSSSCRAAPDGPPSSPADVPSHHDDAAEAILVGVVRAADRAPAPRSLVAVNALGGTRLAVVQTDDQGRFEVPRPNEPFAVTVTSDAGCGVFVPADDISSSRLEVQLPGDGTGLTVAGRAEIAGPTEEKTLIEIIRISEDEGDLFYVPVAADGTFTARLPAGRYLLRTDPLATVSPMVTLEGSEGERLTTTISASSLVPAPDDVVDWVSEHAIALATTSSEGATDDLAPLVEAFGSARIIGVGESTHGTAEFFRLKHRLFRHMVAHHGTTVLAMEANVVDAERVDEFLQTGRGSVDEALRHLFLVWQTEEVRDLLAWMRSYNADPKHRRKLRFVGYDVQGATGPLQRLRAYLERVDPRSAGLLDPLDVLVPQPGSDGVQLTEQAERETAEAAARLVEHFVSKRNVYARRSKEAYDRHLHYARVVVQAQARLAADSPHEQFELRDQGMADNVSWLLSAQDSDAPVMVWAHNGHIRVDPEGLLGRNMGSRLREEHGSDYVAIGLVLNQGEYRVSRDRQHPRESMAVTLDASAPGWLAETFRRVDIPVFGLDLRNVPAGPVSAWLAAPHLVYSCGWLYSEAELKGGPASVTRRFDMVIYVDQTTAATASF